MLRREQRLTRGADFVAVARRGKVATSRCLVLRTLRIGGESTRFGLAVSRAVGGAVARNRVKRRLREVLRKGSASQGWDIVISARPRAAAATFQQLESELQSLLQRAGVSLPDPGR